MREFQDRDRRRYATERELNRSQFVHLVIQRATTQLDEPFFGGSMVTYYAEIGNNPGTAIGVMVRYGTGNRRYIQILDARLSKATTETEVSL